MQLPYLPCYVLTFSTLVVLYVTYKSSTLLMGGRENLLTTAWESKIIGFLLLITLNTLRDVKIPYCQGLVTFQSSKRDFLWLADRWDCFKLCYCQFLVAILNDTCLRVSHDGIWWIKPLWSYHIDLFVLFYCGLLLQQNCTVLHLSGFTSFHLQKVVELSMTLYDDVE